MEYKGYSIESGPYSMKVIKPVGKGSVHLSLRGMYSSHREATGAIDYYENSKAKSDVKKKPANRTK